MPICKSMKAYYLLTGWSLSVSLSYAFFILQLSTGNTKIQYHYSEEQQNQDNSTVP